MIHIFLMLCNTSTFYIFSCKDTGLHVIMYVFQSTTEVENNLVKGSLRFKDVSKGSAWFLEVPKGSSKNLSKAISLLKTCMELNKLAESLHAISLAC